MLVLIGCVTAVRSPQAQRTAAAPTVSPATDAASAGLIEIRRLVPDLSLDIRYAGADNFVGRPVTGYEAPACYLHARAAQALARVERSLRGQGLRLRVYDCYRPVRAVRDFVAWAGDLGDQSGKSEYYPHLDKSALLGDYISPTSGHSRGATVDLTLLASRAGRYAPLDMGTGFDFFDPAANTDSPQASPEQRANRDRLRQAMAAEGFENYPLEWWHYTYRPEPTPRTAFDFPVR
ncbi:M15 family metallopeptidase [Lysobacter antibioticus]|uniref:M15 family metallopeptidase n=1 Tax=Lysobacter antibioticus TaxID=84531 RepID=UPI0003454BAD|nr:M15 family metallopeptidase [Lysobacter antibioticus]